MANVFFLTQHVELHLKLAKLVSSNVTVNHFTLSILLELRLTLAMLMSSNLTGNLI